MFKFTTLSRLATNELHHKTMPILKKVKYVLLFDTEPTVKINIITFKSKKLY